MTNPQPEQTPLREEILDILGEYHIAEYNAAKLAALQSEGADNE